MCEAGKTGKARGVSNYNKLTLDSFKLKVDFNVRNLLSDGEGIEKIYFAGPWFSEKASYLYHSCEDMIYNLYSIIPYEVYFPRNVVNGTPKDAFDNNVENLKNCDIVVALIDEKDVGTAWEIGVAYALGKRIILVGLDETSFTSHTNVMLAFTGECITLPNLQKFLLQKYYDTINIKNEWEGIE